jgi:hypothetical protein
MTPSRDSSPAELRAAALLRLWSVSLASCAGLLAVAWLAPLPAGRGVTTLALGIAAVGSLAGGYATSRGAAQPPAAVAAAILLGLGVRLLLTAGLGLAVWAIVDGAAAVLLATAIAQTVLLVVDMTAVAKLSPQWILKPPDGGGAE